MRDNKRTGKAETMRRKAIRARKYATTELIEEKF